MTVRDFRGRPGPISPCFQVWVPFTEAKDVVGYQEPLGVVLAILRSKLGLIKELNVGFCVGKQLLSMVEGVLE